MFKTVPSFARRSLALFAAAIGLAGTPAWAWPDKPIELVVGFAAGGGTDITARTLAMHLGKQLNTSVVVTNKAGASGELGLAYVAKAPADGYVIGMTNMPGPGATPPIERKTAVKGTDFTYLANLVEDRQRLQRGRRQETARSQI